MIDQTFGTDPETTSDPIIDTTDAKAHFSRAIEEAKTAAQALGKQAQDAAGTYGEKASLKASEFSEGAKARSDEALERAAELAMEGKAKACGVLSSLSKLVEENAPLIDEKAGVRYGDYARTAARSIQDTADKVDGKEFSELADDAREFVRNSPGMAIGIAAAGGFLLSRIFRGSKH